MKVANLISAPVSVALAIVPLNYLGEILGLFSFPADLPQVKIIKDLCLLVSICVYSVVLCLVSKPVRIVPLFSLLGILTFSFAAALFGEYGVLGAVSGFRAILPLVFVLIVSLIKWIPGRSEVIILKWIFYIQLALQIFEFFYGQSRWEVYESIGLNARNAGMFTYPSTAGYFAVFTYIYIRAFNVSSGPLTLAVMISTVLSGSFGALVVLMVYFIITLCVRFVLPIFVFASVGGYALLQARVFEELIFISLMSRVNIFMDIYSEVGVFSNSFGYYSNTGSFILGGPTVDSTINYILGSYGLVGLVLFLAATCGAAILRYASRRSLAVLVAFFLTSLLVSILEVYPTNLLILMLIYRFGSGSNTGVEKGMADVQANLRAKPHW